MRRVLVLFIALSLTIFFFTGCVTSDSPAKPESATLPDRTVFDHKTPRDSVDWASLNRAGKVPEVRETDLEWPGERLGMVGPIVATGGRGKDQFIIIYDPAGIQVGVLTRKAYEKDPAKLAELLAKAQVRSEIQNLSALIHLMDRQNSANHNTQAAQ